MRCVLILNNFFNKKYEKKIDEKHSTTQLENVMAAEKKKFFFI